MGKALMFLKKHLVLFQFLDICSPVRGHDPGHDNISFEGFLPVPDTRQRTRGQNEKVKQMINDIISHQKGLFKPQNDLSDWDVWVTITWMTIL